MSTNNLKRRLAKVEEKQQSTEVGFILFKRDEHGNPVEFARSPGYEPDPNAEPFRFTFRLDRPQHLAERKYDA